MQFHGYLQEGFNFYAKMTGVLGTQYQIIYDFTYARKMDYDNRIGLNNNTQFPQYNNGNSNTF